MRKVLVVNLIVLASLLALAETTASLLAIRKGEDLALVRLARSLKAEKAQDQATESGQCARITRWDPESPYVPDSTLGYWYRKNSRQTATIQLNETVERKGIEGAVNRYRWTLTTGGHGERVSGPVERPMNVKPAVLVLGDSFLFGAGLSDNASLPWQLQSLLPHYNVANYAGGGFGTVHQWLMLRDAQTKQRLIPETLQNQLKNGHVLLGHADYYLKRNVAAPSRLKTFNPACGTFQQQIKKKPGLAQAYSHPRASLVNDAIQVEQIPLFVKHTGPDPSQSQQITVTKALVNEILQEVAALEATPTVLWIRGSENDPVINHYRNQGVHVVDLRSNDGTWRLDNLEPFDNHPGPLSTTHWAALIANHLSRP